jgi:hypothetical protein
VLRMSAAIPVALLPPVHHGASFEGEQRGERAVGKTVSNRKRRVVVNETSRHKLHRCKISSHGADGLACSILRTQ